MKTLNPAVMVSEPTEDIPADEFEAVGMSGKLPALLRGLGAAAVLLSLYGFLMKGWEGSDDLIRYLMLLGHTVALAVIGLASGHWLKEGKGARILLILSLVSVVANFSILGSFLYAEYGNPLADTFVSSMRWSLDSQSLVILMTAIVPVFMIPIVIVGFRVLSRGMTKSMTTLFLMSSAVLLLPMRDPLLVSFVALMLGCYTLFFNMKAKRQRTEAKTHEGMIALMLQFVPIATLLARNIWLYDARDVLLASAYIMGFIALRQLSVFVDRKSSIAFLSEMTSAVLAILAGMFTLNALGNYMQHSEIAVVIATLVVSGMLYELSIRAYAFGSFYRVLASFIAAIMLIFNAATTDGIFIPELAVLAVGAGMVAMSYSYKQRLILALGILMLSVGITDLVAGFWVAFDMNAWVVCALVGVAAIVIGSALETKGDLIKKKMTAYKEKYSEWGY